MADEDKDRYLEEMKVWEAAQRGVTLKPAKPKVRAFLSCAPVWMIDVCVSVRRIRVVGGE